MTQHGCPEYKVHGDDLVPPSSQHRPAGMMYAIPDLLSATAAFMYKAGQLDYIGNFNRAERHDWLKEEWNEYVKAYVDGDEAGRIDGLLDIIVVAWGTILQEFGPEWGRLLSNEVARSNLDKVGPAMVKREDGKVQKPEGWVGPRIAEVLGAFREVNVD